MATVRDLYTEVSEETALGFEECRHLCRTMQQAGLLPKGHRGGWKDAPQIDTADCVRFLLALAGTRTARSRTVDGVTRSVNRFEKLMCRVRTEFEENLLFRLALLIDVARDPREQFEESAFLELERMVFLDNDTKPSVELLYDLRTRKRHGLTQIFSPQQKLSKAKTRAWWDSGEFSIGFSVNTHMLAVLSDLLGPNEMPEKSLSWLRRWLQDVSETLPDA